MNAVKEPRHKILEFVLCIAAFAIIAQSCSKDDKPTARAVTPATATATQPAPVAAPTPPKPAAVTLRDLKLHGATDLALDKRRSVLYVSRNAPRVTLYDTQATHPACSINGKPAQVAEVGRGEYTCYRWVGDTVTLRIDGDRWIVMSGDNFRAK